MTVQERLEALRDRLATLCRETADLTGDTRFSTAAGILKGARPGRKPVDDKKALTYARSLMKTGVAKSPNAAAERAAAMYYPFDEEESAARRLRGKLKKFPDEIS